MKTLLEIFANELDNVPNILNEPPKKMRNSIKISTGALGYFLEIEGHAIKIDSNGIKATKLVYNANNWNATEFASLGALRSFWNSYRLIILNELKK
jgi:hypothetical protein